MKLGVLSKAGVRGSFAVITLGLLAPVASACGSHSAAQTKAQNVASWILKYGMSDVKKLQSDYQASANALSSGQAATAKTECAKLESDTARMLKQPQPNAQPLAKDWTATVSDSHTFATQCLQAVQGVPGAQAAASQTGSQITFDINAVENDIGAVLG